MDNRLNPIFVKMLADPNNALAFQDLLDTAARIVSDFDNHGEVLQSTEDGIYDETTDIEKLRGVISQLDPELVSEGNYLPWLTEEQQQRLVDVTAEVLAWGNGENIRDISYGIAEAKAMTPKERLDSLHDIHDWRCKRLGFDPKTGKEV